MSIFDEGFEEPNVNLPDKTIYEQISNFEKATHGLASLNIFELDDISRMSGMSGLNKTFQYRIILTSQYMKGYSFNIIDLGYDVALYPTTVKIEPEICVELKLKSNDIFAPYNVSCETEEKLIQLITAIFKTNKFKNTVGGLMKLARAKAEDT